MLSEQPAELLDHISSFLDRPKDLLALALTAKVSYAIIVPNHLQFRHLRCDLRRKSLWNTLAKYPNLTSRIRSLELVSETEEVCYPRASGAIIIPGSIGEADFTDIPSGWINRSDPDETSAISFERDCIHAIASAVSCMRNLTRFCWKGSGSHMTQQPELLFAALRDSCPNINELQIDGGGYRRGRHTFEFDTASFPLWRLSNLSRVSLSVFLGKFVGLRDPPRHCPLMMNMLINHCPTLRDLCIIYKRGMRVCILPLLRQGHWPHLERFSVKGVVVYQEDHSIDSILIEKFLERHPGLKCLQLRTRSATIPIMPNTLPHLQSLSLKDIDFSEQQIPLDILQRLHHLASVNFYENSANQDVLGRMHNLRSISVRCGSMENLRVLARAVPQLQRLHFVNYGRPWRCEDLISSVDASVGEPPSLECYEILASLSQLTHIGNFTRFKDLEALDLDVGPILERLAAARNLRYLEVHYGFPIKSTWITIERQDDGTYAGWHFTRDLRDVRFADWGGIFTRITESHAGGTPSR